MPIPRIKIIIIFIIFIMLVMVGIYWEVSYISSKCFACGEEHELWGLLPTFDFCPLAPFSLSLGRMLNLSGLCFVICKMGMKRVPAS